MGKIHPVVLPTWGLTMEEGTLTNWHVEEGCTVQPGQELVDIETTKVTNALEAAAAGVFKRKIGEIGSTYPCGALIGIVVDSDVSDAEIDAFVSAHRTEGRAKSQDIQPQFASVDGGKLKFLTTSGEGDGAALLIHGFAGNLGNWTFVQGALSMRAVSVDLPGHGESFKDLSTLGGFAGVAKCLLQLLDHLQIEASHLVAHSMGAAIALHMARLAPERVRSLSLLAPLGLGRRVNPEFIRGVIEAKTRRQLSDTLKLLFSSEALLSRQMVDDMLKAKRIDGAEAALRRWSTFIDAEQDSLSNYLRGIMQPLTIISGAADRVIPEPDALHLPTHAEFVLLDNTGHMPHIERPAATTEAINECCGRGH